MNLINSFLAARNADDPVAIAGLMAADAVLHTPRSLQMGPYSGPEAIAAALTGGAHGFFDRSTIRRNVHTLFANGDLGLAAMRTSVVTKAGEPHENEYVWIFRCRDGLIAQMDEHLDTLETARVVGWAPPLVNG